MIFCIINFLNFFLTLKKKIPILTNKRIIANFGYGFNKSRMTFTYHATASFDNSFTVTALIFF